jgi:hypothetical protein
MAVDPPDGSLKLDEVNKVASEACTRAGAFALLVSVLLFVLCVSLQERKADEALAGYVGRRLNLAMFVEELQKNQIWQNYAASHHDADQKPLAQLLGARVEMTPTSLKTGLRKPDETPSRSIEPHSPNSSKKGPAPPTILSVTTEPLHISDLGEMSQIVQFWRELNDSDLLTRSRETSNYFSFSITKWANRRNALLYSNSLDLLCTVSEIEVPRRFFKSARYVPQLNDDALMNCTTLRNLTELAQYEMPQMSSPSQLGTKIGRDVDLSPGSLPKDPYAASLVAEGLLFFVLVYFSAFVREAASTESFPAWGTLFGAFSRTRWMLVVFLVALWMPFLACCAVAFISGKILLGLAVTPVLFATFSAHRTLEEKSYFGPVSPFAFLETQYRRIAGS